METCGRDTQLSTAGQIRPNSDQLKGWPELTTYTQRYPFPLTLSPPLGRAERAIG
jgi:hypothetical protein